MDRIDAITATVDAVTARIEVEIQPFQTEVIRLSTIPGIGIRQAQVILAETGTDMARFPTARHLASWAGIVRATTNRPANTTVAPPATATRGCAAPSVKRQPRQLAPGTRTCRPDIVVWPRAAARNARWSPSDTAS